MLPEGFVLIDKPQGWSSFDVVKKCRGLFKERKIGHLGTLDPMATGLLVLALGSATKQISKYMGLEKEYEVEMELGKRSDTYDAEGQIEEVVVSDWPSFEQVEQALSSFWGTTQQVPPAFSAKWVGGKRAYQLARKGREVKLEAVTVEMQGSDLAYDAPIVRFKVRVSSGTYVRSLVHDLGQQLGTGAILTSLRRTKVGEWSVDSATTIPQLMAARDASSPHST